MSGPVILLGCPKAGKTWKAWDLAVDDARRMGYPILLIDTAREEKFAHIPHALTVRETIERVWGEGEHTAYTPAGADAGADDFNRLAAAAQAGKHAIIVITELKHVLPSHRSMSLPFQMMVRLHRHSFLEGVYACSQSYEDAARPLKSVVSEWYIFRLTAGPDLRAVEEDFGRFGVTADRVFALPSAEELVARREDPSGAYIHVKTGF